MIVLVLSVVMVEKILRLVILSTKVRVSVTVVNPEGASAVTMEADGSAVASVGTICGGRVAVGFPSCR